MTVKDMIADLREGFEEKLGVEGRSFAAQLRKAQRHMPHKVRRDATFLAQSIDLLDNPKLARMVDPGRAKSAYLTVRNFLDTVDLGAARREMALGMLASVAFGLLVIAVVVLIVLVQRGFV